MYYYYYYPTTYYDNYVTACYGDQNICVDCGRDKVVTGDGNDTIHVGDGAYNYVNAGNGNNTVYSGTGNDTIYTGHGNDRISSGAGCDTIESCGGDNKIDAGSGDDTVKTGNGNDLILAGTGNDNVYAGGGDNIVFAGDGCDVIQTCDGDDRISGGSGHDTIYGGNGNNVIDAGSGSDYVQTGSGNDRIYGGSGNDEIHAGDGCNVIDAGDGCDTVKTGCDADVIDGGAGNDYIKAGSGNDVVNGGSGSDKVYAECGNDKGIYNFTENEHACDYYNGGFGCDTLVIELTQEEYCRADVQRDLACLQQHIDCGWAGWPFYFQTRNLTVVSWEHLEIVITDLPQLEAVNDTATTTENAAVTVDVLANDTTGENDTLSIESASILNGAAGSVSVVNNQIVYTPEGFDSLAAGETKTVQVSYNVTNGSGETATATLSLTITGENDGPVANADSITIEAGNVKPLLVLANDTDVDGPQSDLQLVSLNVVDGNQADFSIVNNDVVFNAKNYSDLAFGQTKTFTYSYVVQDGANAQATATGEVVVTGTNDLVKADNGIAYRTDEDTTIQMDVLNGVSSLDTAQTLSIENVSVNSDAVVVSTNGQTITLDPVDFEYLSPARAGQPDTAVNLGTVQVTYDVVSTSGQRQTVTKEVMIDGVNDAPTVSSTPVNSPVTLSNDLSSMKFNFVGDANLNNGTVQLTDNKAYQAGAMWSNQKVDISESFTVTSVMNFGSNKDTADAGNQAGADGIALVIQGQSSNELGVAGGGQGYAGIKNSFAIEIDTFYNPEYLDSTSEDHVSFSVDGGFGTSTKKLGFDIEDGQDHTVTYAWDKSSQTFTVSIDGNEVATYQGDITATIGDSAYIGFTAATGSASNNQSVKQMNFSSKASSSVSFDVVADDIDRGDTLSLSANLTDVSLGTLLVVDEDTLQFTPAQQIAEGEVLNVEYQYTVTDSYGGASTATSTIQVVGSGSGFVLDPTDTGQFIV